MLKNISDLGNVISKEEQKFIQGGHDTYTITCTFSATEGDYWVATATNAAYAGYYTHQCHQQGGTPSNGHVFIGDR
ncbi:hypothetical protein [Dokdonia sp.]|uniref:hypothetical protein n=1 Tax=Dokdonia sp. TaxID=2024995 RepID=UPI003267A1EE